MCSICKSPDHNGDMKNYRHPYFKTKKSYKYALNTHKFYKDAYSKEKINYQRMEHRVNRMIEGTIPYWITYNNIHNLKNTLVKYKMIYRKAKENYELEEKYYNEACQNSKENEKATYHNINTLLKKHLPLEICKEIASFTYIKPFDN
tara:strand:+ start:433 stop:873 length:441 start_codon:yes stop_codon:yes gene_type:complete